MSVAEPMKPNPILDEIHKLANPLFKSEYSASEWDKIWNQCCEDDAADFDKEGLTNSANTARGWKAKT